ncbi:hypothetical protein, partial [Pseudomonas sp. A-R-19]|uniref:hypothetical protein n=1 Tax=Pseudomonas sp. A-R-19 TaxID=2832403 RepID=UPI001CBC2825
LLAMAFSRTPSPASRLLQVVSEHETFVMKPRSLRSNVTYLAGCGIFSNFAKVCFQIEAFT